MAKKQTTKLQLDISAIHGKDANAPAMRVYIFDSAGRLTQSVPAKASLSIEIDAQQRNRITVGPDLIGKGEAPPAGLNARLASAGAISRDYIPQQPVSKFSFAIQENLILLWLFVCMNIHGNVRKLLNPGGTPPSYAPICTGTVQIFTIDLACTLGNLSDGFMLNLKNQVLANMLGVEISDILGFNWSDFARVSALAAGLYPLTGNSLRNYIVANKAAIAPFMCNIIPEWAVCYTELPDATIQSDGSFSLEYCFLRSEAPPDLYFEVVQTIDGVTREVADPDIICTTMWGYDGSQGAVITVLDPSAIAGQPNPNPGPDYLYVWPTAIGNVDLGQIAGLETLAGTGLLPVTSSAPLGVPWGGTLSLQVQFDPNLRSNNVMYYRWSYQFDGAGAYTQMNASVTHRWQEVTFGPGGVIDIHLHPVTLGPQIVGGQTNLFEIPDPSLTWIDIDDPADRPFAYFNSMDGQNPASGMVTLKLEMFDGAGNHLPCGNAGHGGEFQFILPDPSGTPNSYTSALAPNIDSNGDLIFRIQVDNNPTVAQFPQMPNVGGAIADNCGMLHYSPGDQVTITYVATQPEGFLTWGLSVTRGASGIVASTSGDTSSAVPAQFTNPASTLVGPCVQAAFAVNLNTYALATDGYGRQSQYDRSATIAFALLTP